MHRLHHHVTPAMYPPRRIVARFLRRSDRTRESDSARTLLLGRVTHRYVGWVITPLWLAAELLDYACHRATHIETTSSAHESILHNALALETALPVLSALWLRANPFSLLLMTGSSLLHTATGVYDIAYTEERRTITQVEQHVHSVLELVPYLTTAFMLCLYPDQALKLVTGRAQPGDWLPQPTSEQPSVPAALGLAAAIGALGIAPYAEELWRCYRAARTVTPLPATHPAQAPLLTN